MREHMGLFRGKRTDNGEWVEGSLYIATLDNAGTISKHFRIQDITYGNDENGFPAYMSGIDEEVDPDTVGECSGLTDRNGKLIFEGDIVRFTRYDALGWRRDRVGQVLHHQDTASFYVLATTGDGWGWPQIESIEVIGNIHDNPELEGPLIVPPCEIGDTVWSVVMGDEKENDEEVEGIIVTEVGRQGFWTAHTIGDTTSMDLFTPWEELGQRVFLTRQEAEAAMERSKSDGT